MNERKALRVAQVGLGGWGRSWYNDVLPLSPDAEAVALVDGQGFAGLDTRGVPGFRDLNAALAAVDVDAVLVTTGIESHYPVVRSVLERGLPVLVEKPFTVTLAEAETLIALADSRNVALGVAQNYRYWPAATAAAAAIRDGAVGTVRHAQVHFRRHHADYAPALAAPPGAPSGSILYQISVHHFDLVRFILGDAHVDWAHSWPVHDHRGRLLAFSAGMTLESGVVVDYSADQLSAAPSTPWSGEWFIEGSEGVLMWGSSAPGSDEPAHAELSGRGPIELPTDGVSDRVAVLREFAAEVRGGRGSGISGAANLGTIRMLHEASHLLDSPDAGATR